MAMEAYQNRRSPKDGPDDYPTPSWATRAMLHHVLYHVNRDVSVWEPAANRRYMVRPLQETFRTVYASDYADYGAGYPVVDFLSGPTPERVDWIITNPPFNRAEDFALRALSIAERGVALFVRNAWAEGKGRYERLFSRQPPTIIAQHVERVALVKGRADKDAVTTMPYSWFVWEFPQIPHEEHETTEFRWIPPCRKEFDREEDWR